MGRTVNLDVLDDIRVASPCPMSWERMVGDDKRRYCEHCGLHVHDLSAMSRDEALAVLEQASNAGRVCARFYRRADGRVLTRDCPVGLGAARARLVRACGRIAAVLGVVLTGAWVFGRADDRSEARFSVMQPFATLREWLRPLPPPPRQTLMLGAVCLPPAPPGGGGSAGR